MDAHAPEPGRDPRPVHAHDGFEPTVLAFRPLHEWGEVQGEVIRSDAGVAELLLGLVRETAASRNDETRLFNVIAEYAFRAFPNASNVVLATRNGHGPLETRLARARNGVGDVSLPSRTIVSRVLDEGCALLYALGQGGADPTQSIVLSRLETAICAPLMGNREPFGVLQLDIRRPAKGRFTREDVDLLSVLASQVGLALEHLQMHQQQRRAFQSTINALLHSLTLKDPAAAEHSERVQALSIGIGRHLGLDDEQLEVLSVSALLHDLGKQGVRDEVLFKPDRLTDEERDEMSRHAAHTQSILDTIEYPEHLRDVPRVAAYHHEKLDGTGPFGIAGDDLPLAARIISVADVFDALISPRVYKQPLPPDRVLDILLRGSGVDWDATVVEAVREGLPGLLELVYGITYGEGETELDRAA